MTTAIAPATAVTSTGSGDDLDHIYCCDPTEPCAAPTSAATPSADFEHPDCVVCADLEDTNVPCSPTCAVGGGWC